MGIFLTLAFLFFVGSVSGWVIELFYRRFVSSSNPERKWVNPGFCTGPYLPIYGFGLCAIYLIASLEANFHKCGPVQSKLLLFVTMALCMTGIEYLAGVFCLNVAKVRLWDYTDEWGNIQGIICPKYSLIWAVLGALYYFLIHPHILDALEWLAGNLAFSFVIGLFFGIFLVDVVHATQLVAKIRQFAQENDVIVRYEALKAHIRQQSGAAKQRYHFFRPFRSERPLREYLKELRDTFEKRARHTKKR